MIFHADINECQVSTREYEGKRGNPSYCLTSHRNPFLLRDPVFPRGLTDSQSHVPREYVNTVGGYQLTLVGIPDLAGDLKIT